MILQALYQLAKREMLVADPDFPLSPVAWLIRVGPNGEFAGIADTRTQAGGGGKRPKLIAKSFPVPYQSGRSGTKAPASFLVDNAKYVFGRATGDKSFSIEEGVEKSTWFRERIAACAHATSDEAARAVLALLEGIARAEVAVDLPADCRSNDLFAFVYTPDIDRLVHMRPDIQAYWRELRRLDAEDSSPSEGAFECMVTGVPMGKPARFPKVKYVPGGQSAGTPLVSFNANAFTSYGLKDNENAPICREAAEACAVALQRLLHPAFSDPRPDRAGQTMARRNYELSHDTVACYWSDGNAAEPFVDVFSGLFDSDPAVVRDMYHSVWRGKPAPVAGDNFFALIVSGVQGRMMIRDWYATSVALASEHLAQHFMDLSIVRNAPPQKDATQPPALPLRAILDALAPLGRKDAVPPALAASVFSAAIRGAQYPLSLLKRAVERTRAEAGKAEWGDLQRRDARVAIIKAVMNRRRRQQAQPTAPEITVALDTDNTNPGYLCGRLMAMIERLQLIALDDVNATVVDRFFGAASATPRVVFTRLLRNARHHVRKVREEPEKRGTARWLEAQIDSIVAHFDVNNNGFPSFLDLEQQGLFIVGYHHQRHEFRRKRDATTPSAPDVPVDPAETEAVPVAH